MSRFLKFIVHFVIILTILDVIALAVPPFLGINTVIVDGSRESNLPVGSVTYAKPVSVSELQTGDSILSEEAEDVYRYKINSIDPSSGVFNVYDQRDVDAGEKSLSLRNTAPKVLITIGYIGYLIIATQSVEGLVIIGLAIIFLIILFILAELWRKDKSDGTAGEFEEGAEGAGGSVAAEAAVAAEQPMTKRQLKKEMKRRAKEEAVEDKERTRQEIKEATRQLKEEAKARKKEEKRLKKEAKKRARTGGFIEDLDPIEAGINMADAPIEHGDVAADEAKQILRQEIAAATQPQEEKLGDTKDVVISQKSEPEAEEPAEETAPAEQSAEQQPEEPAEASGQETEQQPEEPEEFGEEGPAAYRKLAIPRYTADELLIKAREEGDAPEVLRDEQYGVTLLDYSDIILKKEE